jgi:hypothetical protein
MTTEGEPVDTIESLQQRIAQLESEMQQQQAGALMYIAAVVAHAVGVGHEMRLSNGDLCAAAGLELERGDAADGGLVLRVTRPDTAEVQPELPLVVERKPVLARAETTIVLLDPSGEPNQ